MSDPAARLPALSEIRLCCVALVELARRANLRCMLTILLLFVGSARAHELNWAELSIQDEGQGRYSWAWGRSDKPSPATNSPAAPIPLQVDWPAPCHASGATLNCGSQGLNGRLSVPELGVRYAAVIVRIHSPGRAPDVHTLTARQPSMMLRASDGSASGAWDVVRSYLVLGVEHILTGFDHLLFVFSLLALVGFQRRLVGTVTAFTVAHSLTLAASAFGVLALRAPPVEACIALSIVLVCAEACRSTPTPTLTRQYPSLIAFGFGLIHGLGFAGALQEIGLPTDHRFVALLSFNLGVEAGQLAVIALVWALCRLVAQRPWAPLGRQIALYGMGGLAAYWSIDRVWAIVGPTAASA